MSKSLINRNSNRKRNMLERVKLKEGSSAKRIKLDEGAVKIRDDGRPGLLTLSDDVLLMIFSHVHPVDLLSLARCCRRLGNICCDKTLWTKVDLRCHKLSVSVLKSCLQYLQASTKFVASQGFGNRREYNVGPTILSKNFVLSVARNAMNLTTLILENHVIDSSMVLLEDFPATLEHLAIRNCIMENLPEDKSYFLHLYKILPKLRILDLSGNHWFSSHSLLALSKSLTLEELILDGCDVTDALPYASLAANFGFKSLKALDLRNTNVSDIEISCFNRMQSLQRLYLCGRIRGCTDAPIYDSSVTDHSMLSFGGAHSGEIDRFRPNAALQGFIGNGPDVVIIEVVGSNQRTPCNIETLVVRNYPNVTDVTLKHAAAYFKYLKFIDVSGSGCSQKGIIEFKRARPDVFIKPGFNKKIAY